MLACQDSAVFMVNVTTKSRLEDIVLILLVDY